MQAIIIDRVRKKIREYLKKYWGLFIGIFIFSPFLVLICNTYPYSDDFSFGTYLRSHGYFKSIWLSYFQLNGRYSGFIFQYLFNYSLLLNTLFIYKLILLGIFISTFISFYKLFFDFLNDTLLSNYLFLGFSFVYLYNYPTIAEGFSWLIVASAYTLGNCFFVFWLISLYKVQNKAKYGKLGTIILTGLLPGFSETYILVIPSILIFIMLIDYYFNKKINKFFLLILIIAIIGGCCALLSPGNFARMNYEFSNARHLGLIRSLYEAIKFSFLLLLKWFNSPLLLLSILYIPIGVIVNGKVPLFKKYRINPFFSFCLCFLLILESVLPSLMATGNIPFSRSLNISYHLFVFSWLFFIQNLISYFSPMPFVFPRKLILILLVPLIFSIKNSDSSKNNFGSAYKDIFSGNVYLLGQRWIRIIEKLRESREELIVPYNTNRPPTLYHGEIDTLSSNEYNLWMAQFYFSNGIRSTNK